MKKFIKSRKLRYGSVATIVTLLALAVVIIINVITATLAARYEWMYKNMNASFVHNIGENCEDYVEEYVIPAVDETNKQLETNGQKPEKITVIFCDEEENVVAETTHKYVLESVRQLSEMFDGYIEIEFLNIWENPSRARAYGVTATTDVVCTFNGNYKAISLTDFYILDSYNSTEVNAYNGEKVLASSLMLVTQEDTPMCYFTANHGEAMDDYELLRTVIEAGYAISYLDLSTEDIPEDCDLLITFDPKQDLIVSDSISAVSEVEKLNEYMNAGGKYMIFLSADTFVSGGRANLEAFMADWGITYKHETGSDGIEDCYMIKDPSHSLSVDGYTVLAEKTNEGIGAEILSEIDASSAFGNTTCIDFANGFESDGKGNYTKTVGDRARTVSALMTSHSSAEAWAGGRAVARASEDPFVLMAIATQDCENGEQACLVASASTEFAKQIALKSAALSNNSALTYIFRYMGMDKAPVNMAAKSFGNTNIESLPTSQANTLTVLLTVIPAAVCAGVGIFVLVRRRYL